MNRGTNRRFETRIGQEGTCHGTLHKKKCDTILGY